MGLTPIMVTLPEDGRFGAALTGVLDDAMVDELTRRLEKLEWHEARQSFYRQREVCLTGDPGFADLFTMAWRRAIAATVGAFFRDSVSDSFDVAAHQMLRGDYIAPHTDQNRWGEKYRLTVTLNREWQPNDGGVLLILKNGDVRSATDAWLPTRNNGFLFGIGPDSWHAVRPVATDRPRLSLILTFKCCPSSGDKAQAAERWYPFPWRPDIEQAIYNASAMDVAPHTFAQPYRLVSYRHAGELLTDLGMIRNAPPTMSYSGSASLNTDEQGRQLKGSDTARIAAVARHARLPPITLVRCRNGEHLLVNGSHRLSHAVDAGLPIAASLFDEM